MDDIPTNKNTKAEIQAYLDEKGIEYNNSLTKDELLDLISSDSTIHEEASVETDQPIVDKDVEDEKQPKRVMVYTKNQLIYMSSFPGSTKDLMFLALKNDVVYTLEEALAAVQAFSESLWW